MTLAHRPRPQGADAHDEWAALFRAFVEAHRERAVRMAWRLIGGDLAAAEDLAQEAFVRVWSARERLPSEEALPGWFYQTLHRLASNHRRSGAVRRWWAQLFTPSPALPAGDPDDALGRRIAQALERLPDGQREAFVLVHLEGFTVGEAATITGKAPGTLKSHLHRALTTLREELSDVWGEVSDAGGAR